jgi:hypothetical protein
LSENRKHRLQGGAFLFKADSSRSSKPMLTRFIEKKFNVFEVFPLSVWYINELKMGGIVHL